LLDGLLHARFRDDDRLYVQASHKLNVVHREDVRGVNHRQRQRRADARERQHRIFVGHFARDEANHRGVNVKQV
jgi:hypothetical protein